MIFLRLAKVPVSTVSWLLLPAALTVAAILAAAFIPGLVRYVVLALVLGAAIAWSLWNIPEPLRPYIGRFASKLPRRAAR